MGEKHNQMMAKEAIVTTIGVPVMKLFILVRNSNNLERFQSLKLVTAVRLPQAEVVHIASC